MSSYIAEWGLDPATGGCNEQRLNTSGDLDRLLDQLDRAARPVVVSIYRDDEANDGLQIGTGHADHGFALMIEPGGSYAYDPMLSAPAAPVEFDYNGEPTTYRPDQLRITRRQAHEAAREYLASGHRPTRLHWGSAPQAG